MCLFLNKRNKFNQKTKVGMKQQKAKTIRKQMALARVLEILFVRKYKNDKEIVRSLKMWYL